MIEASMSFDARVIHVDDVNNMIRVQAVGGTHVMDIDVPDATGYRLRQIVAVRQPLHVTEPS